MPSLRWTEFLILFSICVVSAVVNAAPTLNATQSTQQLPSSLKCNASGKNILCCRPAKWMDLVTFYLGNYIAHAATTKSLPGESTFERFCTIVATLLYPVSGAIRGASAIVSGAIFADTDLQTAARAGALCMVVEEPSNRKIPKLLQTRIHGRCSLPKGYGLRTVPANATFTEDGTSNEDKFGFWEKAWNVIKEIPSKGKALIKAQECTETRISCGYGFVKVLIALFQTLFAITTLYRSRGDQIDRFGYAAFGLTVTSYAVMSIINLLGNVVCPDYPAMYIVESRALRKLHGLQNLQSVGDVSNRELYVDGIVGRLADETDSSTGKTENPETLKDFRVGYFTFLVVMGVVFGVVGGLSHRFRSGRSTHAQRVWTMTWLVFGLFIGLTKELGIYEVDWYPRSLITKDKEMFYSLSIIIGYCAPAIGGFVVVGQMIKEYGVCVIV